MQTRADDPSVSLTADSLPTVVPADSQPLSWPPIGALPRNRLASSATGSTSAISPYQGEPLDITDCHTSDVGHWLAMTPLAGGAVHDGRRAVVSPPYGSISKSTVTGASGKSPKHCQWQKKRGDFEEVPRLADTDSAWESAGTTVGNRRPYGSLQEVRWLSGGAMRASPPTKALLAVRWDGPMWASAPTDVLLRARSACAMTDFYVKSPGSAAVRDFLREKGVN